MSRLVLFALVPVLLVLGSVFAPSAAAPKKGEWHGNEHVQIRERPAPSRPKTTKPNRPKSYASSKKRTHSRPSSYGSGYSKRYTHKTKRYYGKRPTKRYTTPQYASTRRFHTGIVTGIGGDTLNVRIDANSFVIENVSGTKLSVPNVSNPAISDISVGDTVKVNALRNRSGIYDVREVRVIGFAKASGVNGGTAGYVGQQTSLIGNLQSVSISGRSVIMSRGNHDITIHIPSTVGVIWQGKVIGVSEIPVDMVIKVKGKWLDRDTVDATYVEVFGRKGS